MSRIVTSSGQAERVTIFSVLGSIDQHFYILLISTEFPVSQLAIIESSPIIKLVSELAESNFRTPHKVQVQDRQGTILTKEVILSQRILDTIEQFSYEPTIFTATSIAAENSPPTITAKYTGYSQSKPNQNSDQATTNSAPKGTTESTNSDRTRTEQQAANTGNRENSEHKQRTNPQDHPTTKSTTDGTGKHPKTQGEQANQPSKAGDSTSSNNSHTTSHKPEAKGNTSSATGAGNQPAADTNDKPNIISTDGHDQSGRGRGGSQNASPKKASSTDKTNAINEIEESDPFNSRMILCTELLAPYTAAGAIEKKYLVYMNENKHTAPSRSNISDFEGNLKAVLLLRMLGRSTAKESADLPTILKACSSMMHSWKDDKPIDYIAILNYEFHSSEPHHESSGYTYSGWGMRPLLSLHNEKEKEQIAKQEPHNCRILIQCPLNGHEQISLSSLSPEESPHFCQMSYLAALDTYSKMGSIKASKYHIDSA